MEPRLIKVGKTGKEPVEITANDEMTVGQVLDAAGYAEDRSSVYATDKNGNNGRQVTRTESVNGFAILYLGTEVKGAN